MSVYSGAPGTLETSKSNSYRQLRVTLKHLFIKVHIWSEVACSPPFVIRVHHFVHSTVTPGGADDSDGVDRGGYPITTGDYLAISEPSEVGGNWVDIKLKDDGNIVSFQHSLVWELIRVL